jgi:hypothetical protein
MNHPCPVQGHIVAQDTFVVIRMLSGYSHVSFIKNRPPFAEHGLEKSDVVDCFVAASLYQDKLLADDSKDLIM